MQHTIGIFLTPSEKYISMLRFAFIDLYERDTQHSSRSKHASVTDQISAKRGPYSRFVVEANTNRG